MIPMTLLSSTSPEVNIVLLPGVGFFFSNGTRRKCVSLGYRLDPYLGSPRFRVNSLVLRPDGNDGLVSGSI